MDITSQRYGKEFWFALQVKPRYERTAALCLRQKGLSEFLPIHKIRRRWSDRLQKIEMPFFPGYVFCRFNPDHRLPVLTTPGVLSVLGIGKRPMPVDDAEIAALQTVVSSGCPTGTSPFLSVGERVRIQAGPLRGLECILAEIKDARRLIVSVKLLQRSIAVEIDEQWIRPVAAVAGSTRVSRTCSAAPELMPA